MTPHRSMFPAAARLALIPILLAPVPAWAGEPPSQETNIIVYGDDPCPEPGGPDEIVVCARRPEEERYRIPAPLRRRTDRLSEASWGSRADDLEEAQRDSRPNSCSVVGTGGQTGCTAAMIRQWFADRRARRAESARIP